MMAQAVRVAVGPALQVAVGPANPLVWMVQAVALVEAPVLVVSSA